MADKKSFLVLKFGGSSVSSKENWERINNIVQKRAKEVGTVCLVHSALSGVSDLLEHLIDAKQVEKADQILREIKERHHSLAEDLALNANAILKENFELLEQLSTKNIASVKPNYAVHAEILAQGELMSTKLGAAYLAQQGTGVSWQDARAFVKSKTPENYAEKRAFLNAESDFKPDTELQKRFESAEDVIITQGFIAADEQQNTVLLGRGGSDVSAAYFAAKLQADRLEFWSDVPGMFSANPREVTSARLLKKLTYAEAQEIATNGAAVLHPRSILPAQRYNIPVELKCTHRPGLDGTVISDTSTDEEGSVKTIALRENITLVSMESVLMWQRVGFLSDVFSVFTEFGLSVDLISTSESNVTVSLDPSTNSHFTEIKDAFTEALSQYCEVEIIKNISAVSLLGRHIRTILHQLGGFFEVFREHKIYMVNQASNDLNFTFVVDTHRADRLIKELHEKLITTSVNRDILGPSWNELMEHQTVGEKSKTAWWNAKRDQLLDIAKRKGSAYVYDREELERNIQKLKQLRAISAYFYAMKANANPAVLRSFYDAGLGFECVSIGEVSYLFELFPDIDPKRILFTPNFAPRKEYKQGLELDVHVTIDNIFPLREWPELFEHKEVFLRIDPGQGQGHHQHVKTGGNHSKFGIPRFEIDEAKEIISKHHIQISGLHAHAGSGIKNELQWVETANILHQTAQQLGGVQILDLGGGLGIQEFEMQDKLNLDTTNQSIQEFKDNHPEYELWLEPGRFLVATAGVLLSTVTQLKGKGEVQYVGVETGMNSLIRPALYGSHHTIKNLSKLGEPADRTVNIVGPICESGDKLGVDRRFPATEEGDIILVANTGAYGYVMGSNYNMRPPAEEMFLK